MGCGESKIRTIHLTSSEDWELDQGDAGARAKDLWAAASGAATAAVKSGAQAEVGVDPWAGLENRGVLPHSLLETIPSGDLGESLDIRRLIEPGHEAKLSRSAPVSANSLDSGDSGYDEYEDDYAHIITENSARDKVEQVMTDFRPVDLPELLVITGRACTRILSGYEKNKIEEEKILSSLRTEGLLAKPGGKSKSGMSFEIVDMNSDLLNASFASTSSFLPSHKLSRLEERREAVKKNDEDLEAQLAEADLRRKTLEDERTKKLAEISGLDKIEKGRLQQIKQQEAKQELAMQKRKDQLESMRSKLKQKSNKGDITRLKKALQLDSSLTEADFSNSFFND